ncbi:hypothetical protein TOPH_04706 [Tolypocladium ophioglossoides CBS 100239]|uniref:Uncharacterized protein n=1 Tax=Tolypocladium ophioglossoides (strain CBS 100239) TaxID=1163406 RepID=A0A0L0N8T8_TOLOC|nr:hypothetical protein TOPH_04706 [Tolypocladium ophioglossoides CBS 100239]
MLLGGPPDPLLQVAGIGPITAAGPRPEHGAMDPKRRVSANGHGLDAGAASSTRTDYKDGAFAPQKGLANHCEGQGGITECVQRDHRPGWPLLAVPNKTSLTTLLWLWEQTPLSFCSSWFVSTLFSSEPRCFFPGSVRLSLRTLADAPHLGRTRLTRSGAYQSPARNMAAFVSGYSALNEEKILNIVWISILSLEVLMILGVAIQGILRRWSRKPEPIAL